ncbi:hypothetical protein [Piscinibacter sp. XHJ-5]|uniref:hypothetical protein n=1 Tax=Piscinibacter sp. XHJ-5 TaxID=3037797 RepID=UPI002452B900|nr:hypothetical protein [Piscinibacter sp. XHJ-5]
MRRFLVHLLAASAFSSAGAEESDRLRSPGCVQALAALQAQEARHAPAPAADRAAQTSPPRRREDQQQLEALRREAARACLGGTGDPTTPTQREPTPNAVPPAPTRPTIPPASPAAIPAPALPSPPTVRPSGVASCDGTGCWTTDGIRLRRSGPVLVGPRGPCTQHGSLLRCP